MVAAPLLGLLFATGAAPCTPFVVLEGLGPATDALRAALLRGRVVAVARPPTDATGCAVRVHLEGAAPPYTLHIARAGTGGRALAVRSVELASAMVESAVGGFAPPPREDPDRWQPALSVRAAISADGAGAVYLGPEASLTACVGPTCWDLHARFGQGLSSEQTGALRREVSAVAGGALQHVGDGFGVRAGLAAGLRWSELTTPARQPSTIAWTEPRWPFEALIESQIFFAWEGNVSTFVAVADGWTLDGQIAVQHVPGAAAQSVMWVDYSGEVVVRLGLGVRWGMAR